MSQFIGFGDGSDGVLAVSSPTTDAPIDSSCSGAATSISLSATNASFADGKKILIHQSRGTGVGNWEINQILSYVAGTITTTIPLVNTYTDSGASQAQVLVIKEYTSVDITSTLTAKAWNGNVGGILCILCNGAITNSGIITAKAKGYSGGANTDTSKPNQSQAGEGTIGDVVDQYTANGNGGGGGLRVSSDNSAGYGGGAGGGHANVGTAGQPGDGAASVGGEIAGSDNLTTMVFGGGGGSMSNFEVSAVNGGIGGGIIFICTKSIINTGQIIVDGGDGGAGAGGSAGGSILIKTPTAVLGSGLITAAKGITTPRGGGLPEGGDGSIGRIRVEACTITGTTTPSASESIGGHSFCGFGSAIL
jgi:hypothetical protein